MPGSAITRVWADAERKVFWLDRPDAPGEEPPLPGATEADLAIVGGGFTGLWAAIQAKEDVPARDVVLLEKDTVAFGASGRNGGFCDASLTHGLANGVERFPDEIAEIEEHARESFVGAGFLPRARPQRRLVWDLRVYERAT